MLTDQLNNRIEEQLKESERRFKQLAAATTEGIGISIDGKVMDANQQLLDMLGCTREELIGKAVWEFMPEEDRQEVGKRMTQNDPGPYASRVKRKDGTIFHAEIKAGEILYQGQQARVTVIYDISRIREVEEALKESQRNLSAVIENTRDVVLSIDRDYNLLTINSIGRWAFDHVWGVEVQLNKSVLDQMPEEVRPLWKGRYDRALSGENFSDEQSIETPEGTMHMEVLFNPIYDGENITGVSVISRDISDRVHHVQQLLENEQRLSLIYNNTTDFMCLLRVVGEDFIIESVNDTYHRLNELRNLNFSKDKTELHGMRYSDFLRDVLSVSSDEVSSRMIYFREAVQQQRITRYSSSFTANGKRVYSNTSLKPIEENGRVKHILLVSRDTTSAEILEQAKKEANRSRDQSLKELQAIDMVSSAANVGVPFGDLLELTFEAYKSVVGEMSGRFYMYDRDEEEITLEVELWDKSKLQIAEDKLKINVADIVPILSEGGIFKEALDDMSMVIARDAKTISKIISEHTENILLRKMVPWIVSRFSIQAIGIVPIWINDHLTGLLFLTVTDSELTDEHIESIRRLNNQISSILSRYHAEKELKISEAHFRSLSENAPSAILNVARDGTILFMNRTLTPGAPTDYFVGKAIQEFIISDQVQDASETLEKVFRLKKPVQYETRIQLLSGDRVWVSVNIGPVLDEQGEMESAMMVLLDISNRREAEQKLKHNETLFRSTFEQAAVGMIQLSLNCGFLKVNSKAREILGYKPGELAGRNMCDLVHENFADDFKREIEDLKEEVAKHYSAQRLCYTQGEKAIWVRMTTSIVKGQGVFEDYFMLVLEDISEQKRNELRVEESKIQLVESERTLNEAQSLAGMGNWWWNINAKNLFVSDSLREIYEIDDPYFKGHELFEYVESLIHPEDAEGYTREIWDALRNKREWEVEYRIVLPSGVTKHVFSKGSGVKYSGDREPLDAKGIVIDITDQKLKELEIQKLNDNLELEVSERTAELKESLEREQELGKLKSRFVSTVSHQFRTPLTVIQSSLGILEMQSDLMDERFKEKFAKSYKRVQNQVTKMTDLMNDVLIMGKIDAGVLQVDKARVNLVEDITGIIDRYNLIQTDGRSMELLVLGEPREVDLDSNLMEHALSNLVSNSFKYSKGSANPSIEIEFKEDSVDIRIEDHGVGIPQDELEHIFEPFYRATNTGEVQGTGLGMAIAKEYIELNGGELEVSSELNVGTKARVTLTTAG